MNRRHFLVTAALATTITLAGCNAGTKPGEKFVGYWQSGQSATDPHPTLIHIARNGDSFIVTQSMWYRMGGYKSGNAPAALGESENILVINGSFRTIYEEATDTMLAGKKRASRIDQTQYERTLADGQ